MPDPNTSNPSSALYGLRKATSIGADPRAEAFTQMQQQRQEAALPNPENKGLGPLSALTKLAGQYIGGPAQETLGESNPMFTPVGGEDLYNVAKTGLQKVMDPIEAAYHAILQKGGR